MNVLDHTGLVVHMARKYHRFQKPANAHALEDFVQEGYVALLEIAGRVDGRFKPGPYLVRALRWRLLRLARSGGVVRTPDRPKGEGAAEAADRARGCGDLKAELVSAGREDDGGGDREEVAALLAGLGREERELLEGRFGLCGRRERTLDWFGKKWGLTRQAVHVRQRKALDRLREELATRGS